MLGVIIGDIIGSRFEWHNIKTKEFELFGKKCHPTDDTNMSLAIAKAIMVCDGDYAYLEKKSIYEMQRIGRKYFNCGFGGRFKSWIKSEDPQPYYSYGNGSAMRISACVYAANTLEEAIKLSEMVTVVTHNHPEGIKGAEAATVATYMARNGSSIDEIRAYINEYYYPMNFTLDEIRPIYCFDVSCQGSVPQAIMAFLESTDFEDAIRNAISIGGDSDTIAAIAGGIAGAYYGIPSDLREQALNYLDPFQKEILYKFENKYGSDVCKEEK